MKTVQRALEGSTVVRTLRRGRDGLRTTLERSGITAAVERLETAVRGSYCYRWLTTEPEPDVIVIDLKDTYTVGPILRLLDRVFAALERGYATSRVKPGVDGIVAAVPLRELRDSRVGRGLAAALEPPEPSESSAHLESSEPPESKPGRDREERTGTESRVKSETKSAARSASDSRSEQGSGDDDRE